MAASSTQIYSTLRVLRTHGLEISSIGVRLTFAVPDSMNAERVTSWLKRYRDRVLQILSIEDGQALAPHDLSLQHLYYARYCVHQGLLSEMVSEARETLELRLPAIAV